MNPGRHSVERFAASINHVRSMIKTAREKVSHWDKALGPTLKQAEDQLIAAMELVAEKGDDWTPPRRVVGARPHFAEGDTVQIKESHRALYAHLPDTSQLSVGKVLTVEGQKRPYYEITEPGNGRVMVVPQAHLERVS